MKSAITMAMVLSLMCSAAVYAQKKLKPPRAIVGVQPTHADVHYGPNARHVMDVWLAKSDKPTPVLVAIHGGGFHSGDKTVTPDLRDACLNAGISVIAITYRMSTTDIAPAQFEDCARAIQFIRSKAGEWNLDPARVAATGNSAGAGISLWLAFHPDMADPASPDPVGRQSTRLTCVSVFNAQTTYDPRVIRKLLPAADTYKHGALEDLYGVKLDNPGAVPADKLKLFEEASPINYLTRDDPPVQLTYSYALDADMTDPNVGIHHPRFGTTLKEKMDALGIECPIRIGTGKKDPASTRLTVEFITRHFTMAKAGEARAVDR